jgi:4-amino-4-deoxychorismate lyase
VILVDGYPADHVPVLDRGFAYGDGVFRTMRAQAGRIAHWPLHYRKLQSDCERLQIACPGEALLRDDLDRVLAREPRCIVRITVTRGRGERGYAGFDAQLPVRVVATAALPAQRPFCEDQGVRVRWCRLALSHQPALAGVKHLNRLENVLARREWNETTIAEGLLCDAQGNAIGGTMSNLFILEGTRLVTPVLDRCGVAGVQRERLLGMGKHGGLDTTIEPVARDRLLAADQLYLVNSVIGLWWVSQLGERNWKRSATTAALQTLWNAADD